MTLWDEAYECAERLAVRVMVQCPVCWVPLEESLAAQVAANRSKCPYAGKDARLASRRLLNERRANRIGVNL